MEIEVTQEHIRKGKRENQMSCPVALALNEQGNRRHCVEFDTIYWTRRQNGVDIKSAHVATLSVPLQGWIHRYDTGRRVEPFTLIMENAWARMAGEYLRRPELA